MKDWWEIPSVGSADRQRLGYPTQKPECLIERVITASSNEGDIVLDPFCGCGTTIAVAQRLKRRWMGIDITCLATALIKHRLKDTFGEKIRKTYKVIGEPVWLPDAETLDREDPYQFQWWALGLVDARPVEQKKGADKGIDGRLYFHDEAENKKTKTKHATMQILTAEELLSGKTVDYPHSEGVNVTFNKAPKAKAKKEDHPELKYPEE